MGSRSKDKKYRQWRHDVVTRDGCCVLCGSKKRLTAHHINDWSHFKEDRYNVNNGITLCGRHHRFYHCSFNSDYRVKCTRKQFEKFMKLYMEFKGLGNEQ